MRLAAHRTHLHDVDPAELGQPGLHRGVEGGKREFTAESLPEGHPLASRDELRPADLAGEPWVLTQRASWPPWHRKYDEDFHAAGFEPAIVQRATNVHNLLGLVAAGDFAPGR